MLRRIRCSGVVALVVASLSSCGGQGDPAGPLAQGVAVEVMPAVAELRPSVALPFSAFVTGAVDTSVTWEITEPTGGTIDAAGLYVAPEVEGVYHVVARSAAEPSASATAEVTVTALPDFPTGKAIGANLSWWTYWDSQAFADTARQASYRTIANGFLANTDANGWPTQDFKVVVGTHAPGSYAISFTGQATVRQGGAASLATTYDAATNRSTATYALTSPTPGGFTEFNFTSTRRLPSDAPGTGLKDLRIMRPGRAHDAGTAATRFEPDYVAAVQTFQWFRAMQTMGIAGYGIMGNTDVHWSDADAIAAGVPSYQPGATYRFGQTVMSNGKVYLASFPWNVMSGASGSSAPNHHAKVCYDSAVPADGAVHWGRAARVRPFGAGADNAGPSWEDLILLANRTNVAPWFTIPYFASDLYVTKLARLIRYGSDATGEPYTSRQANPVYPPLNASLPFIVEWSNEIWNSYPYPGSYNVPLATAEYTAGNPWRYTSTDQYTRGLQRNAALTARMSLLFRQVFGDADMMTRVRPVWSGQLGRSSELAYAACGEALKYLAAVWNDHANPTVNGYAGNHPPSYYLYGVASAPYNAWSGATVDALFSSWNANLTLLTTRLTHWDQWASDYGIKHLTYEGTNEQSSALVTQGQADPRYAAAVAALVQAFWNAPRGTADVYAHFRMDSSANNSGLGVPAAPPYGNGDYVQAHRRNIATRDTPGWNAVRALRAETGR